MKDLEFGENIPTALVSALKNANFIEHEITLNSDDNEKALFGIIDGLSADYTELFEIKTGKHPWNQSQVDKDTQMPFYANLVNIKYGVIPKAKLVYVETKDSFGGIEFTGKVEVFERTFTADELSDFDNDVFQVCEQIEAYIHQITEVEVDRDSKLLELISEKKRIDAELDLLKSEILLEMKENDNKYAQSENFNITLASRNSWTYSEQLTQMIKEQGVKVKEFRIQEEKNGTAKSVSTEYLLIKPKK